MQFKTLCNLGSDHQCFTSLFAKQVLSNLCPEVKNKLQGRTFIFKVHFAKQTGDIINVPPDARK